MAWESSYGSNFSKTKIVLMPILKIKLGFGSIIGHIDSKPIVNYQLAPHFKIKFPKVIVIVIIMDQHK
jgi:hypothetical protein